MSSDSIKKQIPSSALLDLAGKLAAEWKAHREKQFERLPPEQREERRLTPSDDAAISELLDMIGHIITGTCGPADLRRVHAALLEKDRGIQERQRRALIHCGWAIWAYQAARRKVPGETSKEHKEYLARGFRRADTLHARMLIDALAEEDSGFARLRTSESGTGIVTTEIANIAKRANGSPVNLLLKLSGWSTEQLGTLSEASLKKVQQDIKKSDN